LRCGHSLLSVPSRPPNKLCKLSSLVSELESYALWTVPHASAHHAVPAAAARREPTIYADATLPLARPNGARPMSGHCPTPSTCLQVEPPAPLPPGEAAIYADATLPPVHPPPDLAAAVPEDPDAEFGYTRGEVPRVDGPRVINVGVPGPGVKANMWRRAWRDKVRARQHGTS
jgi:hypothetical protein